MLEKYPKLSADNRQFVREQVGKLIPFLPEAQEKLEKERGATTKHTKSIEFEDALKKHDSGKKKRKK